MVVGRPVGSISCSLERLGELFSFSIIEQKKQGNSEKHSFGELALASALINQKLLWQKGQHQFFGGMTQ